MKTSSFRALVLGIALSITACGMARLSQSWADPGLSGPLQFKKIAVVFLSEDAAARRAAEDALVKHIKRTQAVASYTLLTPEAGRDVEAAKARLREAGVDGVAVMRVVAEQSYVEWTPASPSYSSIGSQWGWAAPGSALRQETSVWVDSSLYSLSEDRLLYSARSESISPPTLADNAVAIAIAVADDLEKRGLIAPR